MEQHIIARFQNAFLWLWPMHQGKWSIAWSSILCSMPNHASIRSRFSSPALSFNIHRVSEKSSTLHL